MTPGLPVRLRHERRTELRGRSSFRIHYQEFFR